MNAIAEQRCYNHAEREAVARCPECRRFFCRECVVEHETRVLCTPCLGRIASGQTAARRRLRLIWRSAQFLFGFLLLWTFFYVLGQSLLELPAAFHETTMWAVGPMEREEQ
jgi:hypothetical protein